tara:strand:+ start:227 stop:463 length:237 start_codon:yes stop_codon:yes gene_type:complete
MKKIISFSLVLIISFFANSQFAYSSEESVIRNENMKMELTKENKVKDDSSISNFNKDDIFGDEQTFPFVAGLGKNAAH